jgi:uncharacterized protein YkwD
VTTTRARSARNFVAILMAGTVAWTATVVAPPPVADASTRGYFNRSERCLMKRINDRRAARGLHRLSWDPQMGYVARNHSRKMARYRSIWHDSRVGRKVTRWYRLAQNTGRSRRCGRLVRSFMRSSTHRANILGRWGYIGAGVIDTGRYKYVQVLFESSRNPGNIWGYPNR